jgi:hypothetical protein
MKFLWNILKRIPYTGFFILGHFLWLGLYRELGDAIDQRTIMVPMLSGVVPVSITWLFQIAGLGLLAIEVARSIHFKPKENNIDAFVSMIIMIVYIVMVLYTSTYQTELFLNYTLYTIFDVFIGMLAMFSVSRRSVDTSGLGDRDR